MKIVTYRQGNTCRAALFEGERLFDLQQGLARLDHPAPVNDVKTFLGLPDWRDWLARLRDRTRDLVAIDAAGVALAAPIPSPGKLVLSGANTFSHLKEAAAQIGAVQPPKNPMVLAKSTSAVSGPFDDIVMPPETRKLDYEVEIGVVIGRVCRRQSEADIRQFIAGYLVMNDVSARDVHLAEDEPSTMYRTHFVGKSFDTFAPMGPALTTLDEFGATKPLRMRSYVNGELRQDGDTSDLCHGIEKVVSYLSTAMTLYPGDIISSGTPAGVGMFRNPPEYLKPGDVVACEVDGVGRIENRVRAE